MKIVLLSHRDKGGGASIAARRLHQGLLQEGHESIMAVKHRLCGFPGLSQVHWRHPLALLETEIFHGLENRFFRLNRTGLSNTWFSLPYPGYDLSRTALIAAADVINLHWVVGFQSPETIAALLDLNKPIVWTLHDMNPFSGGCHYTAGCAGFIGTCRDCPQLRDNHRQLPAGLLAAKKKLWKKGLTIVSPSRWLAARAAESSLFRDFRIEVIANSLDAEIYCVRDKQEAKKALGIDPEQTTLLFSSLLGRDKRKGLDLLLQTLKLCLENPLWRKTIADGRLLILTLGPYQEELREAGIPIRRCGVIDDDEKLAGIYQAADLLVIPSREENLPNVILEALACATPVLSFAVGGMPDVIKDNETGFMAPPFACDRLAMHLQKVVFDPALRRRLGENGRRLIEQNYTLKQQAKNYLTLFNDLLNHGNSTSRNSPPTIQRLVAGDIELEAWPSPVGDFLFSPYRESALTLLQSRFETQKTQLAEQEAQITTLEIQLAGQEAQITAQETQLRVIRRGISFRLGRILTWPARWLRKTVQKKVD